MGDTDFTKDYDCLDMFDTDCIGNEECFENGKCADKHMTKTLKRTIIHPNYDPVTFVSAAQCMLYQDTECQTINCRRMISPY